MLFQLSVKDCIRNQIDTFIPYSTLQEAIKLQLPSNLRKFFSRKDPSILIQLIMDCSFWSNKRRQAGASKNYAQSFCSHSQCHSLECPPDGTCNSLLLGFWHYSLKSLSMRLLSNFTAWGAKNILVLLLSYDDPAVDNSATLILRVGEWCVQRFVV